MPEVSEMVCRFSFEVDVYKFDFYQKLITKTLDDYRFVVRLIFGGVEKSHSLVLFDDLFQLGEFFLVCLDLGLVFLLEHIPSFWIMSEPLP